VVFLIISGLFFLLAKVCFRNWHKAAFFTVVVEMIFVSYGQVFDLLKNSSFASTFAHHRYLIIASFIIIGAALVISVRMKSPVHWTKTLNLIIVLFFIIPIFKIVSAKINDLKNTQEQTNHINNNQKELHLQAQENPDIYYLILDSYTRGDSLLNDFQFDNSEFLTKLRALGFYVADCSRSNYAHTRLSLASSLNLDFLQNLGLDFTSGTPNIGSLDPYILDSLVQTQLAKLGYKTVAFQTGYGFTSISNADYYIETSSSKFFSPYLEPFEYIFLQNSAVRIIMDTQNDFVYRYISPLSLQGAEYRARTENTFKELPKTVEIPSPKFVFVHLDIPHHPFIFLPDGSINPDREFYPGLIMPSGELRKQGYINQVQFVNQMILPIIQGIIENSKKPPIIILQGDHGLDVDNRVKILNAIYLPGKGRDDFYPSISPVNTFRVIFNNYFGTNLPLLKDQTYNSVDATKMVLELKDETSVSCVDK
jgi:hypothetical protein